MIYEVEIGNAEYPFLGQPLPKYYFHHEGDARNAIKLVEDILRLVDNFQDSVDVALEEIEDEATIERRAIRLITKSLRRLVNPST